MLNKLKAKAAHLIRGENAEDDAHQFLVNQGLELVDRNFRCKQGELDLIMLDKQSLVSIEVRFRKNDNYGSAAESLTPAKQSRILAATQFYLSTHKIDKPIRFDVVAINGRRQID
jgi:putative endonuclease